METLAFALGLVVSFLLAFGLSRAVLVTVLRLVRIGEPYRYGRPKQTRSALVGGDTLTGGRLTA